MRRLTPADRQRLVQRVFSCGQWPELQALEREIARDWAATPEQRAVNDAELQWVRAAARARREMVGRGGSGHSQHLLRPNGAR